MNSPCLYIEISQSFLKLLHGNERFEFSLDRLQNGRWTEACKQKLAASLQDFLKRKNWQPRLPAMCAIGARGVSLRRLTLPATTKEELRRLLRLQIESEFPLPPEQLAWGYQLLKQNGSRQQGVLVVAVKKELIEDYSEILSACGMSPVFTVAAMARSSICPQPPQSYAVLDIGRNHSELLSIENEVPASIRILAWGGESITHAIEEKLGITHDEAEKIKLRSEKDLDAELGPRVTIAVDAALETLAECIHPKWIGQKLYLSGRSVRQKDFASRLGKYLGTGVKCEVIEVPDESLSAAIVALKKSNEVDGGHPPLVLHLNETKNGESSVARSAPWKWAALAAAFATVLVFLPYAEALLLKSRTAKKLSAVKAESGRLAVIDRELSFLQDLKKNQSPYLDTVYLVANSTPPGTRFDTFAMNRRGEVALKGNMGNAQQVTEFRTKLIGSGFFSTVVVDEQTPTPDRQKVAVRITAQWKPATSRKPVVLEQTTAKTEKPKTGGKEIKPSPPPGDSVSPTTNTPAPRKESKE